MTRFSSHPDGDAVWAAAMLAALFGAIGLIGADALWLVPLGDRLVHGQLPQSIPYATAPTAGWHDVPAGAQVVFWSLYETLGGARGLALAQAAASAIGVGVLARSLQRETGAGTAVLRICALVLIGALPAVVIVNVSLFSLALFPTLLALLESETRSPSRRVWLSVPLLACWGNLHGEVLVGWGLLVCYLVLDRARRQLRLSLAVIAAATAALFANPELWHTARYYSSVLHNALAKQGSGLWAPLGTGVLDLLFLAAAAILLALSLIGGIHLRLWEAVALLGLAAETVRVARTGTWLLFLLAYPAARALHVRAGSRRLLAVVAVVLGCAAAAILVKGPRDPGSTALARLAARTGRPVLAEALLGQQVVLAGGRVWVDNPIDAFRQRDQKLYVDWLAGKPSGAAAVSHAGYVLVKPQSAPGRVASRDRRLTRIASDKGGVLYGVRSAG